MEGWKFSVALAFLLVACAVQASPNIGQRTCEQIPCSQHSDGRKFADPANKCGYCCCVDNNGYAETHKCVDGGLFNEATQKCEGENRCGPCSNVTCNQTCLNGWMEYPVANPEDPCGYCLCPIHGSPYPAKCNPYCGHKFDADAMQCVVDPTNTVCPCHCNDLDCPAILKDGQDEVRIPNPDDRCGFCCCRRDHGVIGMEIDKCPFHEMYDETTNDCIPDPTGYCKDPSTPPTRATTRHPTYPPPPPPGKGGCETVKCPTDPTGVPLYACPNDPQSYCQCDWGGHAHQMPCSPGTIFDSYEQVCV